MIDRLVYVHHDISLFNSNNSLDKSDTDTYILTWYVITLLIYSSLLDMCDI